MLGKQIAVWLTTLKLIFNNQNLIFDWHSNSNSEFHLILFHLKLEFSFLEWKSINFVMKKIFSWNTKITITKDWMNWMGGEERRDRETVFCNEKKKKKPMKKSIWKNLSNKNIFSLFQVKTTFSMTNLIVIKINSI